MRRFSIRTALLVIVILASVLALIAQHQRAAIRESRLRAELAEIRARALLAEAHALQSKVKTLLEREQLRDQADANVLRQLRNFEPR